MLFSHEDSLPYPSICCVMTVCMIRLVALCSMMRCRFAVICLTVVSIAVSTVAAETCFLGGESFTLPTVGPITYGQHVIPQRQYSGLDGQRTWHMSFCGTTADAVCNNAPYSLPESYIYLLDNNDTVCETGFDVQTTFWTFSTLNGQPAITANFANGKGNRVAVVTIGCGNSTDLTPVNAADNLPGSAGYPGWDVNGTNDGSLFTFYFQFTTASLPSDVCNVPVPTLAPPTPAPPTPAPAATALCTLSGQPFTLPVVGIPALLQFGQYVSHYYGLDQQRGWQMSFCAPSPNAACNGRVADSYIYELNANGTECGMGLTNQTVPWNTTTLNGLPAITATYATANGDRVAVVTIGCGSSTELTPVNASNIPVGNPAAPGWDATVDKGLRFTIYPQFTTSSVPFGVCSV